MIGLDTNIVVRYLLQDDRGQARIATGVFERLTAESPGFLSVVTMVELVWVLESSYELAREQVAQAIAGLLAARELVVDRAETVGLALRVYQSGKADFADALVAGIGRQAGCKQTLTFNAMAARDAGMTLCR